MFGTFAIKTQVGTSTVHTLCFMELWLTMVSGNDQMKSIEADNLQDAGRNHLSRCHQLKQLTKVNHELAPTHSD